MTFLVHSLIGIIGAAAGIGLYIASAGGMEYTQFGWRIAIAVVGALVNHTLFDISHWLKTKKQTILPRGDLT